MRYQPPAKSEPIRAGVLSPANTGASPIIKFTTSTRIAEDLIAEGIEGANLYRVTWILKTRDIPSFGRAGSAYIYPLSALAAVRRVIKQLNAKAAARESRLAPQPAA